MVDNVNVVGINGFTDAPNWATEKGQDLVLEAIRKSTSIQLKHLAAFLKSAQNGGGLSSDEAKKFGNELSQITDDLGRVNRQHGKEKKYWLEEEIAHKKYLFGIKGLTAGSGNLNVAMNLMAIAGLKILDVYKENISTYDQLTASGIALVSGFNGVDSGFEALRQLTAITGVRFTELAASMIKYSSAINVFSAGKFAKSVGLASTGLTQFGFSAKESADLVGAMLDSQMKLTDVSQISTEQTANNAKKLGASIFKLSLATGVSTAAIMQNMKSLSESTDANVYAGRVGTDAAMGMTTFLASFKDQNLAKSLLKLMSDPIKPLNETFQNLQKVGMGDFAQELTTFTKSLEGMPEEVKAQAMKSFIDSHRGELETNKQRLALLQQAGVEGAGASLQLITSMTQHADSIKVLTKEEVENTMKTSKASKDFASSWEKLMASVQAAFAPSIPMLNLLTGALDGLNWIISGITSALNAIPYATTIIGAVAVTVLFTKTLLLATMGLKALLGISSAGKAAKTGAAWTTSLGADGSGGLAKSAGGGLAALGKGLASIGTGIGKAIGGILEGLAKGLSMLGSPKVLLGTLALVGISASLWITSKAVAEFSKASWEDLAKAGVAILGLTVAVAGLGLIMSTGVGAVAILAGAAAMAVMGAALWALGAGIQSIGTGFDLLSKGFDSLSKISILQVSGIGMALGALGLALSVATPFLIMGSVGLIALGAASMLAGPGIALLAWGLEGLNKISATQLAGIALSIAGLAVGLIVATPLLLVATPGLIAFGLAAAVAAIPISLLAWSLNSLTSLKAADLLGVAASLAGFGIAMFLATPFILMGIPGILALGVASLIAAPGMLLMGLGLKALGFGLASIADIGFLGVIGAAAGLVALGVSLAFATPFLLAGSVGLIALGAASSLAAPGIQAFAAGLQSISQVISSLTGLDKLSTLVDTINKVDLMKAVALGTISALGSGVSLPQQTATSGVISPTAPKPSTLDSPSSSANSTTLSSSDTPAISTSPGTEKVKADTDINTLMAAQSNLLQRILDSTTNLVSVNQDILKYTKANA